MSLPLIPVVQLDMHSVIPKNAHRVGLVSLDRHSLSALPRIL
jgi:hypothetical protein